MTQTWDLLGISAGSIIAPAGCGKTELIASSVARHQGEKPILVLTHTNAGVNVLQQRMSKHKVPPENYCVATIDGWSKRIVSMFPLGSGYAVDQKIVQVNYPRIQQAAGKLLSSGNIDNLIRATYSRLFVGEYQDCNQRQHGIVTSISRTLPTAVLGDPLQAIFNFSDSPLVSWNSDVEASFPAHEQLNYPWRWVNAQSQPLGDWLLHIRGALLRNEAIDLQHGPEGVEWVPLTGPEDHPTRLQAAAYRHATVNTVLILADSKNRESQQNIALGTPGACRVEAVDLRDLTGFAASFHPGKKGSFNELIGFAGSVMTKVDIPGIHKRMETLRNGRGIKPVSASENAALEYEHSPSWQGAAKLLRALSKREGARIYRPTIFYGCLSALDSSHDSGKTFVDTTIAVREAQRFKLRSLPQRAVGSTLLMKGLEADAAVILHPETMDVCHLYVALRRGARRVVVCSQSAILQPKPRRF